MSVPSHLRYTAEHEWADVAESGVAESGVAAIGVTAYAAQQLGDVVYLDLPAVGATVSAGRVFGEIESTKSVSELYAPMDGEVVEVNQAAIDDPALVNADAYAAWLIKVRFTELPPLLGPDEYAALIGA